MNNYRVIKKGEAIDILQNLINLVNDEKVLLVYDVEDGNTSVGDFYSPAYGIKLVNNARVVLYETMPTIGRLDLIGSLLTEKVGHKNLIFPLLTEKYQKKIE